MEKQPLIAIRGLHKKFSKDIRFNLWYGIVDLLREGLGLSTDRATLRREEFWSLRDINLDLREGEILGVVGVNGSGKTTLMRLIANIYPLDLGTIRGRAGLKVTAVFALSSGMQALFTGRENIYVKGAMYGMTKAEIDAKMPFIEDFSELGDKLERPFGNYSSGMKARLAYSVALATEPDVFIIDEALAVGDSAFKAKCMENLREYVAHPGRGVIFVSNHIRKVLRTASRVIVLQAGEIIHESEDVAEGLKFYIRNGYDHVNEVRRRDILRRIEEFENLTPDA